MTLDSIRNSCDVLPPCMFILHVFVIKLEDFSVKCVDKDKLQLGEGEIYDETNFPAAFLHGGSEVR